jgi:hypothetical protein
MRRAALRIGIVAAAALSSGPAHAVTYNLADASGLSAEVEFTLIDPTTLEVRLRNTSTGAPLGFSNSDQLLTGVSWDFAPPGAPGPDITGGTIVIGPTSASAHFSTGAYGPGTSVGGEWGFSNNNSTGLLQNFISANAAQVTAFGGLNLDGPANIDGPQGGLVANPAVIGLGGLGAIQDEVIATLTIDTPLANLDFLNEGVRVEFGSDAFFITVPEPGTLGLIALGGAILAARRHGRR